jgi:hypothetical protein
MTKAENKREESQLRQDPDEPTKPVERQPDTTKGKANQAKHHYLNTLSHDQDYHPKNDRPNLPTDL